VISFVPTEVDAEAAEAFRGLSGRVQSSAHPRSPPDALLDVLGPQEEPAPCWSAGPVVRRTRIDFKRVP
jgi:hypothetical protein